MESKKDLELIGKLTSPDEQVVLKGLEKIEENGSATMVLPLMELICKSDESPAVSAKALEILSTLKNTKAQAVLLENVDNEKFLSHVDKFISAIWNSGIDANDQIARIVSVSLKGDYMAVFEAMTIIESTEDAIPEAQIIESQLACKIYLSENAQSEKLSIVETLLDTLTKMDTYD